MHNYLVLALGQLVKTVLLPFIPVNLKVDTLMLYIGKYMSFLLLGNK